VPFGTEPQPQTQKENAMANKGNKTQKREVKKPKQDKKVVKK
jgi:hypothetical protein